MAAYGSGKTRSAGLSGVLSGVRGDKQSKKHVYEQHVRQDFTLLPPQPITHPIPSNFIQNRKSCKGLTVFHIQIIPSDSICIQRLRGV